ncbi:MAG: M55 family metallopeptidase [Candidatus Hodarchaeota archaeon]
MSHSSKLSNIFILTDLEGVSGVTRFEQSREAGPLKEEAMGLLTKEVNALIRGINDLDPGINIHVWDGHGSGGIHQGDLLPVKKYLPHSGRLNMVKYFRENGIQALLFAGQHAMSFTFNGNLCHTMSSRAVEYYTLNGELVGEFGLRAAIAGEIGVPTIYIAGDDKACEEARKLIPNIVTTVTKVGTGRESADCVPPEKVYEMLHDDVQVALSRFNEIKPYIVDKPVTFEQCYKSIKVFYFKRFEDWESKRGKRTRVIKASSMEELVDKQLL